MTTRIRALAGGSALAAGLWFLTAALAAPPALPKDSYQKAIKADVDFLQKKLDNIVADPTKNRGAIRTVKAVAMNIAFYGEAVKDEALKSQALKVAEALDKKDFKAAADAAKGLSAPKVDAAVKGSKTFALDDVMSPFRPTRTGGQNLEENIKAAKKMGKIEAADAELIGVRTSAIADYAVGMPTDKAMTNKDMKAKWERWNKDMAAASKELAEEGAKGKNADEKKMLAALTKLDNSCLNCHNDFKNEP